MATRLTQRSGKGVSWLAARVMKDYCKDLYKVPKSSFHPSIPQTPLAVPWHLNDTESVSAYQDAAEEEVKWGNVETFGGSSLHSLGEYMLPKPLEELDLVEKFSLLRFHHFEEVRRLSLAAALGSRVESVNTSGVLPLITTLEEETLRLREDQVMDGLNERDLVLGLAAKTEEEYFVAPLTSHWLPSADDECEFLACP